MNSFNGEYLQKATGRQYTYVAFVDPTGFRAVIKDADGDIVGEPSIVYHQSLSDTPGTRQEACERWVESSIDERFAVR